ncbi:hypothetical protein QBZ16_002079 [Prototheca wickerhamii]|uniref:E3 UFM1-protein ligase 1 homolog n=1 Tax=Prototheca wickerhamii TaxID=3111 RepID=A0AAD9IJH0_PROWI|nr:hypothetical protein QBZ16_002079 [Prototheca wickerhamii]
MDASLLDLLQDLENVQAQKTETRFSERNVVELVAKLRNLGLLGTNLLYTTNGREYVTPEALQDEIITIVRKEQRVPLIELPNHLGVDLSHCKDAAEAVGKRGPDEGILYSQDELFADEYFAGLASDVAATLEGKTLLSLGQLAVSSNLAPALIQDKLAAYVGGPDQPRMANGFLYNPALANTLRAQLRGALRAAQAPVELANVLGVLGYAGNALVESLAPSIVAKLISQGGLENGTLWLPAAHTQRQEDRARDFYSQNGYIDWDMVRRLAGAQDPKAWARKECAGGLILSEACVGPAVISQLEAALEEAQSEESWLDVETILPASLGVEDRAELLRRGLGSVQGTLQPVAETSYVISSVLVEKMVAEAARIGKSAKPVAAPGAQAGGKGGPGAQTKKGMAEESARAEEEDDDDDDWGKGSGKRGKKGKKGGARGAKAAPKAASSKAAKPAREPESQTPPELEPEALARAVAGIPEADAVDLASEPALLESLTPALRAAALAAFAEAERARRASGRDRLHSLRGRYSQAAQSAFEELCECDAARAALMPGTRPSAGRGAGPAAGEALRLAVSGKRVAAFAEALRGAGDAAGLWLREPDKKRHKALLEAHVAELAGQVRAAQEPPLVLALAVPLAVGRALHRVVRLPGRALGPTIGLLEGKLAPEAMQLLQHVHAGVLEDLKKGGSESSPELQTAVQALKDRLLA